MAKQKIIYTVGGTVQAGGGLYIERAADNELLELCRQGELAFILSSRQVGKSSLMVRTVEVLQKENIRSVIVDLSAIGVNVTPDEWYFGILNELAISLNLKTEIFAWWEEHKQFGATQRLVIFFREVLLKEVKESIVLFFDEIDTTLSIPFSDDFFAAIRAIYNARSTTPDFTRLSFVLIGVATPGDLISDSKRTPFNIGSRVELSDFTLEEARPLTEGLGDSPKLVLECVFDWTSGHPYLTQRLCAFLAKETNDLTDASVAAAVETLFIGEGGRNDNNLQFVRDMLTQRAPDVYKVLKTYQEVRQGKSVMDDEQSLIIAHLKIAGIVHAYKGLLTLRNSIYKSVFDEDWVARSIPLYNIYENIIDENWVSKSIPSDYDWLKFHTELQFKAREWETKKDASRLLRGKELRETERFLAKSTPETEPLPTELQRQYVELSQKNEKRRKYLIAIVALLILGLVAGPILLREKAIPGQWVSIPAGNFVMGMDEEEAAFANSSCQEGAFNPSGCIPADELLAWSGRQVDAKLDEYAILENEVTNGQYKQCVDAGGCTPSNDWNYQGDTLNQPAAMLNWYQAGEYCAWLGGRLPTEEEWEKAARGADGKYFPWGNTWDPDKANLENYGVESIQSVAKYASSDLSPYGVMNMAGNVQEWTASELSYLAEGQIFANPLLERENDGSDWPVIVRGGSWKNERSEGMGSYRGVESVLSRREEVGFRCICPDNNNKTCASPWNGWWIWFGLSPKVNPEPALTGIIQTEGANGNILVTIYVDENYSGIEDGTLENPYNTILEGRAIAQAKPNGAWLSVKQEDGSWGKPEYIAPVNPGSSGGLTTPTPGTTGGDSSN